MSIRIAGQVVASAGSLTAHNEDPNAHPDIRELIGQGGGGGGYSKEEIDNKFIVVDTAILGNADAIQKTRSDFMESDSELQQQINAHAEELTTQKNDIDELGDQVAGIESKIPEGTSDTNPLINRQQLLDEEMDIREDMMESDSELQTQINALAEAIQGGGGGGSVPDNVYTVENFIAGKNVTFTEVPPEGGIDEHTLACWHFDDANMTDIVSGYSCSLPSNDIYYKFGNGGMQVKPWVFEDIDFSSIEYVTVDFWLRINGAANYWKYISLANNGSSGSEYSDASFAIKENVIELQRHFLGGTTTYASVGENINLNEWVHIAIQRHVADNKFQFFLNGKKIIEEVVATTGKYFSVYSTFYNEYIDELRISDCIRYTEDFTPPTKAYTVATGTSKTAVNAVIPEVDIPEGIYTQTNLLGGKDIEIVPEPVEGGIDENTVACWHFDGDTKYIDSKGGEHETTIANGSAALDYTSYYKFGTSALLGRGDVIFSLSDLGVSLNSSFTIEGFLYIASRNSVFHYFGFAGTSNGIRVELSDFISTTSAGASKFVVASNGTTKQESFYLADNNVTSKSWFHVAIVYDGSGDDGVATLYLNGEPISVLSDIEKTTTTLNSFKFVGSSIAVDEVRISNIARYKGQPFTPPTKAYEVAEPTGNMVVNFVGESLQKGADYVVESYNEGTNWYRVYKSGWIEQGGSANTNATITLLKPMKDTNYTVIGVQNGTNPPSNQEGSPRAGVISTTQIFVAGGANWQSVNYYVCGQGAE